MIRIYVYKDDTQILCQDFQHDDILIGRTSEADLLLTEVGVSRRHARLFKEGESWKINDLGASNGVYVTQPGGEPQAISSHEVSPGDQIHIEKYIINFETFDDASFLDMETMSGEIQQLRPGEADKFSDLGPVLDMDTES